MILDLKLPCTLLSLRVEARNEGDSETSKMQASYRRAGRNIGGEDGGEFEGTYVLGVACTHAHDRMQGVLER